MFFDQINILLNSDTLLAILGASFVALTIIAIDLSKDSHARKVTDAGIRRYVELYLNALEKKRLADEIHELVLKKEDATVRQGETK